MVFTTEGFLEVDILTNIWDMLDIDGRPDVNI